MFKRAIAKPVSPPSDDLELTINQLDDHAARLQKRRTEAAGKLDVAKQRRSAALLEGAPEGDISKEVAALADELGALDEALASIAAKRAAAVEAQYTARNARAIAQEVAKTKALSGQLTTAIETYQRAGRALVDLLQAANLLADRAGPTAHAIAAIGVELQQSNILAQLANHITKLESGRITLVRPPAPPPAPVVRPAPVYSGVRYHGGSTLGRELPPRW